MLYGGNMRFHECVTIEGFADWVLFQPDEVVSLPLFEVLKRFDLEKKE